MTVQRIWRIKMMALFWALAGGAVLLPSLPLKIPKICLIEYIFRIPCPVCGIRSSIAALLWGDWIKAIDFNPMGPIVLISCISLAIYFTYVVFTNKNFRLDKEIYGFNLVNKLIFGLLTLQWGYRLLN